MSVLVFTENWDGKFKKLTYELVSWASEVAKMINGTVTALSIGSVAEGELEKLGNYGAGKVLTVETPALNTLDSQAYAALLSEVVLKEKASVVILSNNNMGKAVAPRLSVRLKAGICSGVSKLPLSTDPFTVYKRAYSGNAFSRVVIKSDIKIVTLAQNSFGIIENPVNVTVEKANVAVDNSLVHTQVKDVEKQSGKILLTDADIVVSGGRGMKSPDNWTPLLELAEALGAATACSRRFPMKVGDLMKNIQARQEDHFSHLYLAVGISGATQHLAGVSASKYIVAVNTDKDAPIFEAAQYGIVGDAMKILPQLAEAVKHIK
jgi:electron transfer flavoprotein alpha subunit